MSQTEYSVSSRSLLIGYVGIPLRANRFLESIEEKMENKHGHLIPTELNLWISS